jgi:hypothetical protein
VSHAGANIDAPTPEYGMPNHLIACSPGFSFSFFGSVLSINLSSTLIYIFILACNNNLNIIKVAS